VINVHFQTTFLAILATVMTSNNSIDLNCNWQKIAAEKLPIERSSHAVSIIGDTLYLFGGENVARVPIDSSIYAVNISPNGSNFGIWQKLEVKNEAPVPRIAHSQAAIGNRIYIFGGRQGTTMHESPLNDLHFFDVENNTWNEVIKPDDTFPMERSFHQMVSVGKSLFVFGGCGKSGRMSDLHEFNTETSKWIKHSELYSEFKNESDGSIQTISGRGGASLIASKNEDKLFLVAGFAGTECSGQEMDDVYTFDLKSKVWKHLSHVKVPVPRSVCISSKITIDGNQDFVVIFGGEVDPSDRGHEGAGGFSNDLYLINEETLEIKTISAKDVAWPIPRGWSSGSSKGKGSNQLVVFGGLTGDDKNPVRLNDLWVCTMN